MRSKSKIIIGVFIIVVFLAVGWISFMDSKIEYVDFNEAHNRMRKVEVKGIWVKDKESKFDATSNTFSFYMVDDNGTEMKVVLDGAKPNNFEVAEAVVAKGKMKDGYFAASDLLTKCPSKYEAGSDQMKESVNQ